MKTAMVVVVAVLAMAASGSASAWKLADGFRGVPFGTPPAGPPEETCTPASEGWDCAVEIAGVPLQATYAIEGGIYYGLVLTAKAVGPAKANLLKDTLTAAWGRGEQEENMYMPIPPVDWEDGTVLGNLKYNQYTRDVTITIVSRTHYDAMNAARRDKAAKSAGDL